MFHLMCLVFVDERKIDTILPRILNDILTFGDFMVPARRSLEMGESFSIALSLFVQQKIIHLVQRILNNEDLLSCRP